jgi:hypothetical protein
MTQRTRLLWGGAGVGGVGGVWFGGVGAQAQPTRVGGVSCRVARRSYARFLVRFCGPGPRNGHGPGERKRPLQLYNLAISSNEMKVFPVVGKKGPFVSSFLVVCNQAPFRAVKIYSPWSNIFEKKRKQRQICECLLLLAPIQSRGPECMWAEV